MSYDIRYFDYLWHIFDIIVEGLVFGVRTVALLSTTEKTYEGPHLSIYPIIWYPSILGIFSMELLFRIRSRPSLADNWQY